MRKVKRVKIPKPVKVGEEYEVTITELGSKGDGIARIKNFVVFVPNTQKDEKVRIKIVSVKKTFAFAQVIQ